MFILLNKSMHLLSLINWCIHNIIKCETHKIFNETEFSIKFIEIISSLQKISKRMYYALVQM